MKKILFAGVLVLGGCQAPPQYDVVIRGGTVYDGSGSEPVQADVGILDSRIAAVGNLEAAVGKTEIDVTGLAVAPGFINMLSWATESLILDGRSQSDIRQGVTLEVFGEGRSMGPLNEAMKTQTRESQPEDARYEINWTTLGEYLESLVDRGIATNVASFVGATTIRVHELDRENRPPTPEELQRMQQLVAQAMEEGALGVGSSLIYAPAFYAQTDELIALCQTAAEYGGMYISHMRSEGDRFLEAVDELIEIAEKAGIAAEIYHLKAAGERNWDKLETVIEKVEAARERGLKITADMYTYTAGSTGLNAIMPPWVQEGGYEQWVARLKDPAIRAQVIEEMRTVSDQWENLLLAAGTPENVVVIGFRSPQLQSLTGLTLGQVAAQRGTSPEDTAIDLVIEDGSRVSSIYFLMTEENIHRQIALPWLSFGSDGGSLAAEGSFLNRRTHPRAYGNFARLLGKYVRDEKVIPLQEAVRKLTSLPAENLKIKDRGRIEPGFYGDLAIFDPATIQDHATFEEPHQYSTGMVHVFVNGVAVLQDGEHTGATPGQVVRGPGWKPE
jgi:N-acyl-D-amino-acid deacylase